jgi:hypothetical protein
VDRAGSHLESPRQLQTNRDQVNIINMQLLRGALGRCERHSLEPNGYGIFDLPQSTLDASVVLKKSDLPKAIVGFGSISAPDPRGNL